VDRNTSHLSLFVPAKLREALERSATENDRSLSAEVCVALRAHTSCPSAVPSRSGDLQAEGKEAS
jgi:hypothetical protein